MRAAYSLPILPNRVPYLYNYNDTIYPVHQFNSLSAIPQTGPPISTALYYLGNKNKYVLQDSLKVWYQYSVIKSNPERLASPGSFCHSPCYIEQAGPFRCSSHLNIFISPGSRGFHRRIRSPSGPNTHGILQRWISCSVSRGSRCCLVAIGSRFRGSRG